MLHTSEETDVSCCTAHVFFLSEEDSRSIELNKSSQWPEELAKGSNKQQENADGDWDSSFREGFAYTASSLNVINEEVHTDGQTDKLSDQGEADVHEHHRGSHHQQDQARW